MVQLRQELHNYDLLEESEELSPQETRSQYGPLHQEQGSRQQGNISRSTTIDSSELDRGYRTPASSPNTSPENSPNQKNDLEFPDHEPSPRRHDAPTELESMETTARAADSSRQPTEPTFKDNRLFPVMIAEKKAAENKEAESTKTKADENQRPEMTPTQESP
jgi:hypothetical protein